MRKTLSGLIVLIVFLSMLYLAPSVEIAKAQEGYSIPITVVNVMDEDLTEYQVKIVLNSTNFSDWSNVLYDNGTDIYFLDSGNQPLYYWVEYFNKTEQRAIIWVKLDIAAKSYEVIYMHYGGDNPHATYHGADNVFVFFDDFLSNDTLGTNWVNYWFGWGGSSVDLDYTFGVDAYVKDGILRLEKVFTGSGVKEAALASAINLPKTEPLIVETLVNYPGGSGAIPLAISIGDNNNYVDVHFSESSDIIGVHKEVSGTVTSIASYPIVRNTWVLVQFITYPEYTAKSRFTYDDFDSGLSNYYEDVTSIALNLKICYAQVCGEESAAPVGWVDWVRVRKLAPKEPHVVIGWVPGTKGAFYVPIVVEEKSGSTLQDYPVKIELNSTNFNGWDKIADPLGSDIYFLDGQDNPLYYWIEEFRVGERATIWVKVPSIPAGSTTTIYMYFGESNPYPEYHNASEIYVLYDDFLSNDTIGTEWVNYWFAWIGWTSNFDFVLGTDVYVKNGALKIFKDYSADGAIDLATTTILPSEELYIKTRVFVHKEQSGAFIVVLGDTDNEVSVAVYALDGTYGFFYEVDNVGGRVADGTAIKNTWMTVEFKVKPGSNTIARLSGDELDTGWIDLGVDIAAITPSPRFGFTTIIRAQNPVIRASVDYVFVRKQVEVEPEPFIGSVRVKVQLWLPAESMFLTHSLAYSPNSTQFNHTFFAVNSTTAGYETEYVDAWGWRVYANPYQSGGTSYENTASLVSEVNITLPYSEILVENITLFARANSTGSLRQLWIKVLNSSGDVIAELSNATMGTGWTEVSLTINSNVSEQITVWVNATVNSTTTTGEEIAIKDVRVYAKHDENPLLGVVWQPNVDYFNCSASFYVEFDSTEYVNSSAVTFKLVEYLIYNTTDYPVQPTYVGNETIGSYNYTVYRIEPANYRQFMTVYAFLENKLKTFRMHVKGYETTTVLVGEQFTVELPVLGNVTVRELGMGFINVTTISLKLTLPGTYTVEANLTQPSAWMLGRASVIISVKYGSLTTRLFDLDSRVMDYETVILRMVNETSGMVVGEVTGNNIFTLTELWACNYTLEIRFKDIVVSKSSFTLNVTTDGSIVDLTCAVKSLAPDYRGLNRSVVFEHDKQLAGLESLSAKFPFSRMRMLVNGTGSFKLYVNYRGDLPTDVSVAGNVSFNYYWDGNYLAIEGVLGSVGELNVTDLYKLRLELYDRLGNYMPMIYVFVNGTKYTGAIIEDCLYPENYVVELPEVVESFDFYGFFDGFDETVRVVTVNNTDVTLKAWYRVPTSVEASVKAVRGGVLAWLSRILQQEVLEEVDVYIEGTLKDYYGDAVTQATVTVNITNVETGFTISLNGTTDISGYFRTDVVSLASGKDYKVNVIYAGNDVYVGTLATKQVEIEAPPLPVEVVGIPVEYVIAVIAAIMIGVAVAIFAWRAAKHAVEDEFIRRRRFVRRKT